MKKLKHFFVTLLTFFAFSSTLVGCKASTAHFSYDYEYAWSTVHLRIVPKHDIDDLDLIVYFYGEDNFLLDKQLLEVGDLLEGKQYIYYLEIEKTIFNEDKEFETLKLEVKNGEVEYS